MSTMSTEDKTYNGWANYPTWNVNLWLSNDEGLYNRTLEIMASVRATHDAEHVRIEFADALKTFVRDELAPDLGASFAADLLGYALDQVDWREVAFTWLDES